jgi:ubiquinone/menaquinone biosynthesis C-methylase UbiE
MNQLYLFINSIKYSIYNNLISFYQTIIGLWYDFVMGNTTKHLYPSFFKSIPSNSNILDIGIGTGIVTKNADTIKKKHLHITGIDINKHYLDICHKKIEDWDLHSNIKTYYGNIFNYNTDIKYDYVLFCDSYSVIPNVNDIIDHTTKYLAENGKIVVITTLDDEGGLLYSFRKWIKPRLVNFIGTEFGELISYNSIINTFQKKYCISDCKIIKNKWFPIYGRVTIYMITMYPKDSNLYTNH